MDERPVVLHRGIYKKTVSLSEAVFMITGMTIGAGVLGIPYVVAQVGILVGIVYIGAIGLLVLTLNLMLGEVAARTNAPLQIPGLARKYLGPWGERIVGVCFWGTSLGAAVAYLVGEGQTLSNMFGGSPRAWAVLFWIVVLFFVGGGLTRVARLERIFSAFVIGALAVITVFLFGNGSIGNWQYVDMSKLFIPYGVILFALHATPAIAEAEALIPDNPARFKKAVFLGTLIPVILYILFAAAVVGVKGFNTTEVATIGLSRSFGLPMTILANLFAAFAMATACLGITTAFTDSLVWDFHVRRAYAFAFVAIVPLALYALVGQSFVAVLDIVGGLFVGVEAIIIALMFVRARYQGDLSPVGYSLRFQWVLAAFVMAVFSFLTVANFLR